MVDLDRTEEQMLAEIGCETCSSPAGASTTAGEGPASDTPWRVTGRTPYELLAVLRKSFFKRYAHLPRAHVSADLLDLVKHGLGNAYKRGNERDSEKLLTVTTVMSDIGAVIKISDQGKGFDVRRVVEQFAQQERYFVHAGSGFCHFQKTTSVISYSDGGRTLLIRFLVREDSGNGNKAKGSKKRWIDFSHLRPCDQVKVKGAMRPDGGVTAMKVSLRPVEELAVIQAPLRRVDDARVIHLLNSNFILSESTEIVSAHLGRLRFEALQAGQVVELTGSYSFEAGFSPVRLQIRSESSPEVAVLKGRIEEINPAAGSFRVLGIMVTTDDQTELIDKR
jgi:Domain of unknown function (DUF5666)